MSRESVADIYQRVESIVNNYKFTSSTLTFQREKARFIASYLSIPSELTKVVKLWSTGENLHITGPKIAVEKAKTFTESARFTHEKVEFAKPGISEYVSENEWKDFIKDFELRQHCVVYTAQNDSSHVENESSGSKDAESSRTNNKTTASAQETFECKYGSVTVEVTQGDITVDKSEAIINGCGSDFNLDWGSVSKAILRRAGSEMQLECTNNPVLQSKHIRVTKGWNLFCENVIHVETPRSVDKLAERIKEALDDAELIGVTSVALPTLGAGGIGLNSEDVAGAMRKAFLLFSESSPVRVKTIKVVVYEQSLLSAFGRSIVSSQKMLSTGQRQLESVKAKYQTRFASMKTVLYIYCKDEAELIEIVRLLQRHLDQVFVKEHIKNEVITRFDEHDWIDVYLSAIEHAASITCLSNPPAIEIKGRKENVAKLQSRIKEICSELREAQVLSKICIWKWSIGQDLFSALPSRICREMENLYESDRQSPGKMVLFGKSFDVSVRSRSFQYDDVSGLIQRLDVKADELPSEWCDMLGKTLMRDQLDSSSSEYQRILKLFKASNPSHSAVSQVERIQNPRLYKQYMIQREDVKRHLTSSNPVERELFHGTSPDDAVKICEQGFDRGFAGKNATAYGNGVYFAVNSSYSENYAQPDSLGKKTMFLAKVLTGDYCQGYSGLKAPPVKPQAGDGNRLYDSVVDRMVKPTLFVVFKDSSVYPTYLITYW